MTTKNLTLNNGLIATYTHTDFWNRPHYTIEYKDKIHRVCCTELNGTYLHTIVFSNYDDGDGEPNTPLRKDFQPVAINSLSINNE